jgi:hypothetical protein
LLSEPQDEVRSTQREWRMAGAVEAWLSEQALIKVS